MKTDMDADQILADADDRMTKAVNATHHEMAGVRTGRASTALFEKVVVDVYDQQMPLNQVASVSVPEPQLVVIQPWDKGTMEAIERAIMGSDLGLQPSNDGNLIRVPFPPLSQERREELVKLAKKMAEDGRVAVRNIRRDANDGLKRLEKDHEVSEDDARHLRDKVQEETDDHVKGIDDLLAQKEKEIMEV